MMARSAVLGEDEDVVDDGRALDRARVLARVVVEHDQLVGVGDLERAVLEAPVLEVAQQHGGASRRLLAAHVASCR